MSADSENSGVGERRFTDAELLQQLRNGDQSAYTTLWQRHSVAALRVAYRTMPSRADDLVAEAFLRVYEQTFVNGNGPESAFRAYLFTVIRNTAIAWKRDDSKIESGLEIEETDSRHAESILEEESSASELLAAFQALPHRWQRVLWLTEVEDVPRLEIAQELNIKPNAVSALRRRARTGLRVRWLAQHIPQSLSDSSGHVADLLPQVIADDPPKRVRTKVDAHLRECATCSALYEELRTVASRIRNVTLAAGGFAALGVVLPAASPLPAAALASGASLGVAAGVVSGTGGALSATALSSVTALTVGGLIAAVVIVGSPSSSTVNSAQAADPNAIEKSVQLSENIQDDSPLDDSISIPNDSSQLNTSPESYFRETIDSELSASGAFETRQETTENAEHINENSSVAPTPPNEPTNFLGRGIEDPSIPSIEVEFRDDIDFPASQPRVEPAPPGTIPRPADPASIPVPSGDSNSETAPGDGDGDHAEPQPQSSPIQHDWAPLKSGITTPTSTTAYLAPILDGVTSNEAQVAIAINGREYLVQPDADGAWSFDLRRLNLRAGTYEYSVWVFTEAEQSTADFGELTIESVKTLGAEDSPRLEISEAQSTGVVLQISGPKNGTVCVTSVSGQRAEIPLGDEGTAIRRIILHSHGYYVLEFAACEDGYRGAVTENFIDVYDPEIIFEPYDPAKMTFEVLEP
ncbi:MAG: sigma-70 family RNA polymerase sigma factor [Gulosibacter sp.]|uniref:RNA polymerase sigma factor n=1 Tax=Gulosibacter sp. TaxID=2817531 RepID=UPI003F925B6A